MNIIPPGIYYLRVQTVAKVLYYHCIRKFSIRRMLVAIVYLLIMSFMGIFIFLFRLLDEILFRGYKRIEIKSPVFIIANPRSGTTFLHRLICTDEEKFVHIRTYHTIIPSITFCKVIDVLTAMDNRIGRPMHKIITWMDKRLFAGWEDVHATGLNRAEEDEGLYFLSGISPAISLVTPFLEHFRELYLLDHLRQKKRERIKKYYQATLQRWMYILGRDKQFLCKSVMSTGRLQLLMELFPDMKLIYIARNPYDAVPSFVNMFNATWKPLGLGVAENSNQSRELAALAIQYYQHFNDKKKIFRPENLITIKYDNLVQDAYQVVLEIYNCFEMKMSDEFEEKLRKETTASRAYKSKHHYSLEQYGLTKEEIREQLDFLFEEYGF